MDSTRLWAKRDKQFSESASRSALFHEHLKDVHAAAIQILEATGLDQLAAFGLDPHQYFDRFRRIVLLAAAIHDLGKANEHFQGMVLRRSDRIGMRQGLRHEWVTILMMKWLREWLLPAVDGNECDLAIAEWAVAGHHPASNRPSPPAGITNEIGRLLMGHDDFQMTLSWFQTVFGCNLGIPPTLPTGPWEKLASENVRDLIEQWGKSARRQWLQMKSSPDRFLVPIVKNCLIAADVAGSAIPKVIDGDFLESQWIQTAFQSCPQEDDFRRIAQVRLNGHDPRPFQMQVAESPSRVTLVMAGCGTGKTVAAYLWAAHSSPRRRLYFCYPTTGTATEGYRDYLHNPDGQLGDINAQLFHSRRDIDFEIILSNGETDDGDDNSNDNSVNAVDQIESLEAWSTAIAACTVDTVLGVLQNQKRGRFSWPALAQSAFVFDEIHAYDDVLFGKLLRFIKELKGLPVLLMTASLPKEREQAIRDVLEAIDEEFPPLITGPTTLEALPRYCQVPLPENDPLPLIQASLAKGEKVLWICNTVDRVLDAAEQCEAAGITPLIYHSRFCYEDRVKRHEAVIQAFNEKCTEPVVAICSQVAEMSLDISADFLITDFSPVSALIQRLGRLNRRAGIGDSPKPFVVVRPDHLRPYCDSKGKSGSETWPEQTQAWLERLPSTGCSQKDLVDCWEHQSADVDFDMSCHWLDKGPESSLGDLRQHSTGMTILLERDHKAVSKDFKMIGRCALSMTMPPGGSVWKQWKSVYGIPVAPDEAIIYDPLRGAQWRKK